MKCSLFLILVASIPAFSQVMSLEQVILTAVTNNPKIQANDSRIRAIGERTRAAWAAVYPSLTVSQSYGRNNNKTRVGEEAFQSKSSYGGASINVSATLFNGGADISRARAAEESMKAQLELYNSSNAFIPNTKGSVARSVMNVYVSLMMIREHREMINFTIGELNRLKNAIQPTDLVNRNRVQTQINNFETTLTQLKNEEEDNASDFEYLVTIPVPLHIQTMAEAVESLTIPANAQEALAIAFQNNSSLKSARHSHESAKHNFEAAKKSTYYPSVDINFSRRQSRSHADEIINQGNSSSVNLSASWSWGPATSHHLKAQEYGVAAAQSDVKGYEDDLKNSIPKTYKQLSSSMKMQQTYEKNLIDAKETFVGAVDAVAASTTNQHNLVDFALENLENFIGSQRGQWSNVRWNRQGILMMKFGLKQTVGLLDLGPPIEVLVD